MSEIGNRLVETDVGKTPFKYLSAVTRRIAEPDYFSCHWRTIE